MPEKDLPFFDVFARYHPGPELSSAAAGWFVAGAVMDSRARTVQVKLRCPTPPDPELLRRVEAELTRAYGLTGAELVPLPSPGVEADAPPPIEEAQALIAALPEDEPRYSPRGVLLGYGVAPAFFAPLFGGGLADLVSAFLCGSAVGVCLLYGGRFIGANGFFRTAVSSALASLLAMALVAVGVGESVDVVTISTLMVLVPGVALTNAMREIMAGDTFSGLSRTADAILVASAIALGAAAGQALGGFF